MTAAIVIDQVRKTYGTTVAIDDLSLVVPPSLVYGLLGPNGAGKTTIVRILATLTCPSAGQAHVAGLDVVRDARAVRHLIGLTGQYAALDEDLTGRENLVLIGRLHGAALGAARQRAEELLAVVQMDEGADRPVRTYSGGMRRRVDLAASLVARPAVLFLDEPTTGLDPRSRSAIWSIIASLVHDGTTVLLTTQYLEEVDHLASRIAVIDRGRLVAEGTPSELKRATGTEVVEVRGMSEDVNAITDVLGPLAATTPFVDGRRVVAPVRDGMASLTAAIRGLETQGIGVESIALRAPTLDEVFMKMTGRRADGGNP